MKSEPTTYYVNEFCIATKNMFFIHVISMLKSGLTIFRFGYKIGVDLPFPRRLQIIDNFKSMSKNCIYIDLWKLVWNNFPSFNNSIYKYWVWFCLIWFQVI